MARTRQTVTLPRDAMPLNTWGRLSGIRLAAAPARGTERRGAVPLGPALPARALACFPESGVVLWGLELPWPALALVFPKVPSPRLRGDSGPKSERTEGARKPSGVAFGKGSPAGEARARRERSTFCPCLLAAHVGPSWTAPQLLSLASPLGKNVGKSYLAPIALCPSCL